MIPDSVLAAGWIPFVVVLVLALFFSTLYIFWFRSVLSNESSLFITLLAILTLTTTLLSSTLVPVDVFLVSFMKYSNGTYKTWAESEETRKNLEDSVLYAYYVFYGLILFLAFLILPFAFFYQTEARREDDDEEPEEPESFRKKICRALKYTSVLLLFFLVIAVGGCFIPLGGDPVPHNVTGWEKIEYLFQEVKVEKGENVMVFMLNVLNVIGMILLIFYTGYGMSSMPINMIKGQRNVHVQRQNVVNQIESLESQIREIQSRTEGNESSRPQYEVATIERLEQQVRLLQRSRHNLEQSARSCINRMIMLLRPFQIVFGLLFAIFGALIFISLLLTSIDKAMNSLGPMHGYIVVNGTLPNPVDILLVYAQDIFPLDYLLYTMMILFFVFTSMSGVKELGIKFFWLTLYQIRANRTPPRALLLMCLILIYILLALNVLMFSIVPDYTTYGSQHYVTNVTIGNVTEHKVEKCDDIESPSSGCNMSRIAYILLAFHSKVWIFGALYYWLVWVFIVVVLVGSGLAVFRSRRPTIPVEDDEDELLDENNPFRT